MEYLEEFLLAVREGGGLQRIQERLSAKKKSFELEKSRAVGRGRPFMKKLGQAQRLSELCHTMARQLGLTEEMGTLALSPRGRQYLDSNEDTRARMLIQGMLQTYVRFRRLVKWLATLEGNELEVPMGEDTAKLAEALSKAGLRDISRIYFETVVNLATQLGLTNWYPKKTGPRTWVLYLTCSVLFQSNKPQDSVDGFVAELDEGTWRVTFNSVPLDVFRERLWNDYLSLARYVARKPVPYSDLRNRACHSLRISDRLFDDYARGIMEADSKYLLVGAGGRLSFGRDSASMIKGLPPKSDRGEYMVYLKMDRKN